MVDHAEMKAALHRATHDEGECSCTLQARIRLLRAGMNVEDWTPTMGDLLARIDQLEAALDEVANIMLGMIERDWMPPELITLAVRTYENARHVDD
jgi:hypothetical protein